jgi:periplasmic mercuric ion binding protein
MKAASILALLALAAAGTALPAVAAQQTVVLSVPSMNCATCPITVRKALEKVAGVQSVKATLEPPEAKVTFDDAKTSVDRLIEATKGAGYPSSVKPGK